MQGRVSWEIRIRASNPGQQRECGTGARAGRGNGVHASAICRPAAGDPLV